MAGYIPSRIESKWKRIWREQKLYETPDTAEGKENSLLLVEFPYPSGNLHMGHWYAFAIPDVKVRYLRMRGYNALYPIGFDAFGLPAENAAITRGINPRAWTEQNIATMTRQLESMGASFDWTRTVSTIDPKYYRWTQWMFLQMYKRRLAYRAKTKVNWCPKDKTVLANEQVVGGVCERCDSPVQQREIEQWMFKITEYADRLVDGLEKVDWPEATKIAQRNWIGRSRGALIQFGIKNKELRIKDIKVFTTRPDTIFGATFLVISPELAQKWIDEGWGASEEVKKYITKSLNRSELERQETREKTGIASGLNATNPANKEEIPIWIADYVLGHYGTGAIMAVPQHDERDREFAEKFGLPIVDAPLTEKMFGESQTTYRLHDWILSRQRYWGCPIPIINCPKCGVVPVQDDQLPVVLPDLDDYLPTDDGQSPLAKATEWLNVKCPNCGGQAKRETDTMDTFVDSSRYYLRYADPNNQDKFADKEKMRRWLPVPEYLGGAEHNTMHLLYSRFFAKVLHDLGVIEFDEPFLRRVNRGIILGSDGQKMSKSRGNVVDPDALVAEYGADVMRMYLAFMAPYEFGGPWDPKGINGVIRFLQRVWRLFEKSFTDGENNIDIERALHVATKKIGEDIDGLHFNTAVSELMKLLNVIEESPTSLSQPQAEMFLKLLAPFAPHLAEEIWHESLDHKESIHLELWPLYNPALLVMSLVSVAVQVNGRTRAVIEIAPDLSQDDAVAEALHNESVARHLGGKKPDKIIYLAGKLLNLVVSLE